MTHSIAKLSLHAVRDAWGEIKKHKKLLGLYLGLFAAGTLPAFLSGDPDASSSPDAMNLLILLVVIGKVVVLLAIAVAISRATLNQELPEAPLSKKLFFRGFWRFLGLMPVTGLIFLLSFLVPMALVLLTSGLMGAFDIHTLFAGPESVPVTLMTLFNTHSAMLIAALVTSIGLALFVGSRLTWSYPLVVCQHRGIFKSIAESWRLSRGRTFKIVWAMIVLGLLAAVITFPFDFIIGYFGMMLNAGTFVEFSQAIVIGTTLLMTFVSELILQTGATFLLFSRLLKLRLEDKL